MAGGRYYRGIRGSAALSTARLSAEPAVVRAEAIGPGEMRRVPVGKELLGAARVRARYAPLPLEAFDRTGGLLSAPEQAAYLQLLRLAYGEGRNFCRTGKRDLMARLSLSERRLNRVLGALVEKGFARPVHRDNRGTLWRVFLPREAFGEAVGDDVLLGRENRSEPAPSSAEGCAAGRAGVTGLARALVLARGVAPAAGALAAAEAEVRGLLEDGVTPERVRAAVRALAARQSEGGKGAAAP